MAAIYNLPLINSNDSGCPFPIGDTYGRSIPCQTNWISDCIRIVLKLKSDPNPFTTFALFDTEGTWDTLFAIGAFTTGSVLYSPDFGDRATWTNQEPATTTNSFGGEFFSDYKGNKVSIPFWNLPPNIQAEILKSVNENPNGLECMFVTRDNRVIYLNDNSPAPTAPLWIPIQAALFMSFTTAPGQAQMVNELRLTFDYKIVEYLNAFELSFDLLNKS